MQAGFCVHCPTNQLTSCAIGSRHGAGVKPQAQAAPRFRRAGEGALSLCLSPLRESLCKVVPQRHDPPWDTIMNCTTWLTEFVLMFTLHKA